MNQRTSRPGKAIEDAAAELGLSATALQLHMADRGLQGISPDLFQSVTTELKARVNSLRLDDLGKIALTVDWLVEHALGDLEKPEVDPIAQVKGEVEALRAELGSQSFAEEIEALNQKIVALEGKLGKADSGDSVKSALQVAAGLQSVVESQAREIDGLRAELGNAQRELASLAKSLQAVIGSFEAFTSALRSAVGAPEGPAGKAKARGGEKSTAEAGSQTPLVPSEPELGDETPAPKFENTPVTNALRYGIRREIEYNYLLERMSYRRLDSYSDDELASGKSISAPSDQEIREFLAKYEVGGSAEEVETVTVHRGEFQMVQYQRVEKPAGLRGWIPKQRK